MSEPQYDDEGNPIEEPDQFRALRAKATRTDKAEARSNVLERENAFLRAGIDIDAPQAKYFVKGYEGDLDKESVLTAAAEIGLADPPTPKTPAIPAEELEALRRIQGSGSDTTPPLTGTSYEDFEQMPMPAKQSFLAKYPEAQDLWQQGKVVPT